MQTNKVSIRNQLSREWKSTACCIGLFLAFVDRTPSTPSPPGQKQARCLPLQWCFCRKSLLQSWGRPWFHMFNTSHWWICCKPSLSPSCVPCNLPRAVPGDLIQASQQLHRESPPIISIFHLWGNRGRLKRASDLPKSRQVASGEICTWCNSSKSLFHWNLGLFGFLFGCNRNVSILRK